MKPDGPDEPRERWRCDTCRELLPRTVKRPFCVGCSPYAASVRLGDAKNKRDKKYREKL